MYGIERSYAGLFLIFSAIASVAWVLTSHGTRRVPAIDALGMGILTSPLWFFIVLAIHYLIHLSATASMSWSTVIMFAATFVTQAMLYIVSAGIRYWESELDRHGG